MASRSDTEAPPPTWTVWPCEYGGVQVEPGRVPPHHQCAVCGERPIAVVPRHELVDVIGRLANESLKRKSVEAERDRYKAAFERIVEIHEKHGGNDDVDWTVEYANIAYAALNGSEDG